MANKEYYTEIINSITNLDEDKALELANKAINEDMELLKVIEKGYSEGIRKIGDLFDEGEFFLPELMLGGKIVQKALDILLPHLKEGEKVSSSGTVVIGTIEGDIHSIGKTIVATMLSANGFDVYDLGADVPVEKFIDAALEKKADVVGISALLTITMVGQKKVMERMKERGIRDKFKVIIGGAPVSSEWAEESGADGYADNAIEAVKLIKKIINK
jgi:corrinoid protein of di/trimethylamine methyltransferase